ncbi:hypothetical protein PENTCL1PPCAC_14710, partial [Pristionchus entomophagus]
MSYPSVFNFRLHNSEGEQTNETFYFVLQAPELALLSLRRGTLIVIGPPAESQNFRYEIALLSCTCFLVVALLIVLTVHSSLIMCLFQKTAHLSLKTQSVQDRLTVMIAVFMFFVLPMLTWVGLMTMDVSSWPDELLVVLRICPTIALSLKPLAQSSIFLGKNPALRK